MCVVASTGHIFRLDVPLWYGSVSAVSFHDGNFAFFASFRSIHFTNAREKGMKRFFIFTQRSFSPINSHRRTYGSHTVCAHRYNAGQIKRYQRQNWWKHSILKRAARTTTAHPTQAECCMWCAREKSTIHHTLYPLALFVSKLWSPNSRVIFLAFRGCRTRSVRSQTFIIICASICFVDFRCTVCYINAKIDREPIEKSASARARHVASTPQKRRRMRRARDCQHRAN